MTLRAGIGIATCALFLVPGFATADAFLAEAPGKVTIEGEFRAVAPAGVARVGALRATGLVEMTGLRGEVRVITREVFVENPPPPASITVDGETRPSDVDSATLENGTLALSFDAEAFGLTLVARDGGTITLDAAVAESGVPVKLAAPFQSRVRSGGPSAWEPAEVVDWGWDQGWSVIGRYQGYAIGEDGIDMTGFPRPASALLGAEGEVILQVKGGNVTFTTSEGREAQYRLGSWTTSPSPATGAPSIQTSRSLVFEGRVGSLFAPASENWGLGAPAIAWELDGALSLDRASGTAILDGESTTFEEAAVVLEGSGAFRGEPGALAAGVERTRFTGDGDWRTLRVDGRVVARSQDPLPASAVVASASSLALALALLLEGPRSLLLRVALGFYTRVAREDLLAHPRRAAIHAIAAAEPGIHLRELHRKVGGGWGIFRAHFDLLVRAGYVRVEAHGKYSAVFLADAARVEPVIPNEVARAAFAALPEDGASVPVSALRADGPVSRQLLNYHLGALERRGLVTFAEDERGVRRVARATPAPARVAARGPLAESERT